MTTPNEAVILRSQLVETWARYLAATAVSKFEKLDGLTKAAACLEFQTLQSASLYVWREDLLRAACSAAETMPEPVTFKRELQPSERGLYLFNHDVPFDGCRFPIRAIAWTQFNHMTGIWLYARTEVTPWDRRVGFLAAVANFLIADGSNVKLGSSATPVLDNRRSSSDSDFHVATGTEAATRFLLASWLWLRQSVMRLMPESVSNRAKKVAERAGTTSSVNVVVLRRADVGDRASADHHGEREWSCQWLVRGHWRQQYYPSISEHRPLWIEPYVKGPDDAPFKAPTETVFAVAR